MFVHLVLFKIKKKDLPIYQRDCRIWEKDAKRQKGFLGYHTLLRTNEKNQAASFYLWKSEAHHNRFMKKHHDRLVSLSKCPVQVLGYFNFKKSSR
jgi:heme-degrading monooxygenase HmoA